MSNGKKVTNASVKKDKITLQRGGIESYHCTRVSVCSYKPYDQQSVHSPRPNDRTLGHMMAVKLQDPMS